MKSQFTLLLFVVLLVSLPSVVFAQPPLSAVHSGEMSQTAPTAEEEYAKAQRDAKRDADIHVSSGTWFAFGLFCGGIGIITAAIRSSNADPAQLVGKSPVYVATYVNTYRSAARERKLKSSATGCATQSGIISLSLGLFLAITSENF